nr:hypothetical protein [uncultured bacterium]
MIGLLEEVRGTVSKVSQEDIEISLSKDELAGQVNRLQEEFDIDEQEANIIYDVIHRLVELMADEKGKDWSSEVIDGVTNLIISMFIQEERQRGESGPEILKNKSKSERIEKTRELLAESEPEKLDLSVGEIVEISDEVLIKKTGDGFILYYVVAKEDVTPETCPQLD